MQLVIENKKDYNKAIKKVDSFYKKACRERDSKGYRENLGYDSQPKLEDYIGKLDLNRQEEQMIIKYFYLQMETV